MGFKDAISKIAETALDILDDGKINGSVKKRAEEAAARKAEEEKAAAERALAEAAPELWEEKFGLPSPVLYRTGGGVASVRVMGKFTVKAVDGADRTEYCTRVRGLIVAALNDIITEMAAKNVEPQTLPVMRRELAQSVTERLAQDSEPVELEKFLIEHMTF